MNGVRIITCGDDALRITPVDVDERRQLAGALQESGDWREVVIGREGVTVQFDPLSVTPEQALTRLRDTSDTIQENSGSLEPPLVVPVSFDEAAAPDLQLCAKANDCSAEAFVARILASDMIVDMIGFAPGFAYVAGVDPVLRGGRLPNPRVKVAAGSIGFIQGFLGIYALDGPGGWPIIGRTNLTLFDPHAAQPAMLTAGRRVMLERA